MRKTSFISFLVQLGATVSLTDEDSQPNEACYDFEVVHGPQKIWQSDVTIENTVFYGAPTDDSKVNDNVLRITGKNVTLRNVIIYHAANTMGIFCWTCDGLTLENV